MALDEKQAKEAIAKLVDSAAKGAPNVFTKRVSAFYEANGKEVDAAAQLAGGALSPTDRDAKIRENINKALIPQLQREALEGERNSDDMKSVAELGKAAWNGQWMDIVFTLISNGGGYAASLLGAAKEFATNGNGRSFNQILDEKEQDRNLTKFAGKLGVAKEQLVAELQAPDQKPLNVTSQNTTSSPATDDTARRAAAEERERTRTAGVTGGTDQKSDISLVAPGAKVQLGGNRTI